MSFAAVQVTAQGRCGVNVTRTFVNCQVDQQAPASDCTYNNGQLCVRAARNNETIDPCVCVFFGRYVPSISWVE